MALTGRARGETFRFLSELLRRQRRTVSLALAGSVAAAVFEGSTMAVFALALHLLTAGETLGLAADYGRLGEVLDGMEATFGRNRMFVGLVILAVACQLLRSALRFGADSAAAFFQSRAEGEVKGRIFRRQMSMPYSEVRTHKVGSLSSYMDQVTHLGQLIQRANALVGQVLLLVSYLVVLLWLSWKGTLIASAGMILASLSLRRVVRRIQGAAQAFKRAFVAVTERSIEFLNGIRLVHTFAREDYAIARVDEAIDQSVVARRQGMIWQSLLTPVLDSLAVLGVGIFLIAGFLLIGKTSSGALARYATLLFVLYRLAPRLSIINKNWGLINNYLPFTRRIARFLSPDESEVDGAAGQVFAGLERSIEFRGVSLRYPDREMHAVEDISFDLPKTGMLALVGESGSGKSSLADLLLRLYSPTEGRILVDGIDLEELQWSSWRDRIGVVGQETFLFNASIRDNIAFGRLDATDQEIEEASRLAHAHEFILELPNGYATVLGDEGHGLSGGQQQRLAIARAVLRAPDILILDEATSDLDSRSEKLIEESLERLSADRTVLAIAHRISTVARADRILVLSRGRIVESGSHEELLRAGGSYAALWHLQSHSGDGVEPVSEDSTTVPSRD